MKLVAESFPWAQDSLFAYTRDNHNSVVGMRELALGAGAAAMCVEISGNVRCPSPCCMLLEVLEVLEANSPLCSLELQAAEA